MAFLAAMFAAKAFMDNTARKVHPVQIVRTASTSTAIHNFRQPRRRMMKKGTLSGNPFKKEEITKRMGYGIRMRHQEHHEETRSLEEILQGEKWIPVYRYHGVRLAVILARAKLIQTIGSLAYLPYAYWNYMYAGAEASWFFTTVGLAVTAPILLAAFSRYFNRLVGVISMDESNDYIRIGYLSFWGSRRNKYVEISNVLPLSEMTGSKSDSIVKFTWYGHDSYLYLPIRHAEIVDEERAELLFGDISIFNDDKKRN